MRAAMWTADDLAVVTDTEEEMQKRWLGWQIGMESKGLKVNTGKTEVMVSSSRGTKSNIKDSRGTSLRHVKIQIFMCHHKWRRRVRGSIRVSAAWAKWRDLSGVISDKKMPKKIKVKLYMTVDQYFCMEQNVGQLERRKQIWVCWEELKV